MKASQRVWAAVTALAAAALTIGCAPAGAQQRPVPARQIADDALAVCLS
jgi:hypothetical protein